MKIKLMILLAVLGVPLLRADPIVTIDASSTYGHYHGTITSSPFGLGPIQASFFAPESGERIFLDLMALSEMQGECYFYGMVGVDSVFAVQSSGGASWAEGVTRWDEFEADVLDVYAGFSFAPLPDGSGSGTWNVDWFSTQYIFQSPPPLVSEARFISSVPDVMSTGILLAFIFILGIPITSRFTPRDERRIPKGA